MGVYKGVAVKYKYDWEKWWTITLHKARDFYKTGMDETNITSITPIPNPPKLLEVGTKVRVFEEYDNPFLDKSKTHIIAGKIDKHATYYISDDWYIWDNESLEVPARAVVPVLE